MPERERGRARARVAAAVGTGQIFAWGSTYYLPAVAGAAIAHDTGWPLTWTVGAVSVGLLVSGLVSPLVARAIDRFGGRIVLAASALVIASGLVALGAAQTLPVYVAAWALTGVGMGAGFYDACFTTLGRLYGHRAQSAITAMTLVGGFASTVCWPLSAYLIAHVGWRATCDAYAAILALAICPLYLAAIPGWRAARSDPRDGSGEAESVRRAPGGVLALIASTVALAAGITTLVSTSVILLLRSRGLGPEAALAVAAMIGPSQVGGRIALLAARDRLHPSAIAVAASGLVAAGIVLVAFGARTAAPGIILYGAGAGIFSIARGMLPIALVGDGRALANTVGRIALPAFVTQAAAPLVGASLIRTIQPSGTLAAVASVAVLELLLALVLLRVFRGFARPIPSVV